MELEVEVLELELEGLVVELELASAAYGPNIGLELDLQGLNLELMQLGAVLCTSMLLWHL